MKESFIFYRSFYEAIKILPDKKRLKIYEMIMELGLNCNKIEEKDKLINSLFALIEPQIMSNNKKYEDGKKGGRPRKSEEKQAKIETSGFKNKKTSGYENKKPNDNVNVNDNDNDNVNVNANANANDLISYIENNGFILYPADLELIQTWEDNEITRHAIKETTLARATSLKYTERILQAYKSKGLKTLADVEKYEKDFREKSNKKPSWFDKDIKEEPVSNEEEEELNELMREFK